MDFFILAFKRKYKFYEFFIFLRKATILFIANAFSNELINENQSFPFIFVIIVLSISAYLALTWLPFKREVNTLNFLECFS